MKNNISVAARRDRFVHSCRKNLSFSHRKIVVGLSGGADSCALLSALCVMRNRGEIDSIYPVHICHNLRAGCDNDCEVSEKVAKLLNCEFARMDIDPSKITGNVYDACRSMRYQMLSHHAIEKGCTAVAVAHHLNDQLETVIFRLARGSMAKSLSGMAKSRKLCDGVYLVRPLLECTRTDCERMCKKIGISWVEDPSNLNTEKTRAFIRHKIVPMLRQINPRIEYSVGRIVNNIRQELKG